MIRPNQPEGGEVSSGKAERTSITGRSAHPAGQISDKKIALRKNPFRLFRALPQDPVYLRSCVAAAGHAAREL
jgi:hypothetical protein